MQEKRISWEQPLDSSRESNENVTTVRNLRCNSRNLKVATIGNMRGATAENLKGVTVWI